MVTGDHKVTAAAIGRTVGIFEDGDIALEGTELDAMSDEQLDEVLPKVSVYARVSPEHKIRIVSAWQRRGCIVSMTGGRRRGNGHHGHGGQQGRRLHGACG